MSTPAGVSAPAGSPPPPPFDVPAGWYDDPNIWFTEVGLITNLPGRIARLEIKK
jgi:hypothetical protein